jgi:hypothetical protein
VVAVDVLVNQENMDKHLWLGQEVTSIMALVVAVVAVDMVPPVVQELV